MRKRVSEEDKKIGARLKARRIALGLTQGDLGECIGVTFQQIQKAESGANRTSAANLAKLAKLLEVHVSYFFAEEIGSETDDGMNFLGTKDGAQIVRAMSKITDARLRRTIAELVVRLADAASLAAHPVINVREAEITATGEANGGN